MSFKSFFCKKPGDANNQEQYKEIYGEGLAPLVPYAGVPMFISFISFVKDEEVRTFIGVLFFAVATVVTLYMVYLHIEYSLKFKRSKRI